MPNNNAANSSALQSNYNGAHWVREILYDTVIDYQGVNPVEHISIANEDTYCGAVIRLHVESLNPLVEAYYKQNFANYRSDIRHGTEYFNSKKSMSFTFSCFISDITTFGSFFSYLYQNNIIDKDTRKNLCHDLQLLVKQAPLLIFDPEALSLAINVSLDAAMNNYISVRNLPQKHADNIFHRFILCDYLFQAYKENTISAEKVIDAYNSLCFLKWGRLEYNNIIAKRAKKRVAEIIKNERINKIRGAGVSGSLFAIFSQYNLPLEICEKIKSHASPRELQNVIPLNKVSWLFAQSFQQETRAEIEKEKNSIKVNFVSLKASP